jgi:signal transduction histidine kinase
LRRSIRIRVLVSILAVIVPVIAASAWALARAFGDRIARDVDVALEEEAETLAGFVASGIQDESLRQLVVAIAAEKDLGAQKHVAVTRAGRPIAEAPAGSAALLSTDAPRRFRLARYRSGAHDGEVEVAVAVSGSERFLAHRRLVWLLWIGTPLVSALLGFGVWTILGRALRPLERAADGLGDIEARTLSSRLPVENAEDEVGRIVHAANEMLARIELAVGRMQRFTAEAAHELRTPLTVLRTGLEVALSKERSLEETREALRGASQQTERLCRLAEDLLTLARLDVDAGGRPATTVDLTEIVQELADAWREEAENRQMRFAIETAPPLRVDGDPGDLYRMLGNLIENAVRHGDVGGEIRIHGRANGASVALEVIDDGPGIPPDERDRVFERFYRGRTAMTRALGSGLGLAIAREIARTHGGALVARNREDGRRGSVFAVSLPRAKA